MTNLVTKRSWLIVSEAFEGLISVAPHCFPSLYINGDNSCCVLKHFYSRTWKVIKTDQNKNLPACVGLFQGFLIHWVEQQQTFNS